MNKKNLVITAVALTCAVAGAAVGMKNTAPAPATAGAVSALFAQSMNDAAGKAQALSVYKGKPLVVNFWAPWCAPCVQEMPELSALSVAPGSGVQVIGIGIDSPTNIAEFAGKFRIAYPLYVAGMGGTDLARAFGNAAGGLPYTVLIGADGQVRKTYLGRLKFDQLKADLAALKS